MRPDWLRATTDAVRRNDHRNMLAVAGLGAAIAIGDMEWFSLASHFPLAIPVLAGAVLLTAFAYVWHRWQRRWL